MQKLVLLFIFLPLYAFAYSYDVELEGFSHRLTNKSNFSANNLSSQIDFETNFSNIDLLGSLKVSHDFEDSNDLDKEISLNELYLQFSPINSLEIFAGRKKIILGKGDEFNPTDFISGEDYRYFLFHDKAKRARGSNIVGITSYFEDSDITVLYIPSPRGHIIPSKGSIWRPSLLKTYDSNPSVAIGEIDKDYEFNRPQFLAKYSLASDIGDMELVYFNGFSLTPEYEKSLSLTSINLEEKRTRSNALGASWAYALNDFTIRTELSYRHKSLYLRSNLLPSIERKSLLLNIGADYNGQEDLFFNLQYIRGQILNYQSDILVNRTSDFLFLQIKQEFFDNELAIRFRAGLNLESEDGAIIHPNIAYTLKEKATINLGTMIFGGADPQGLFSQYKNNDLGYVRLNLKI